MAKQNDQLEMYYGALTRNFEYAKQNRVNSTPAESALWEELRNKKLKGYKFRRQHPVGIFILDFYCHAAKLAIEIDGEYHLEQEQQLYDRARTELLYQAGIKELRFTNQDILTNLPSVLGTITQILEK
ncbi:MAG TPA: endonuclease domain-containing protein [Haliscomenobacter sp.]|uniref:endonuclease domain-containing protein n=1 Tax=Haliscomenobacter sp. TaxID=2717303 RepID=UPI002B6E76D9|nr:endonuclease domain-containing protein [Haliscomenobacter sp.]HOY19832.1 endonuclease domain-containing protein [Haliscomenobacter sp.]